MAHGGDDLADAFGLAQEDGAALVFVDGGGGAAEVEVDFLRACGHGGLGVGGHVVGVATEQLEGAGGAGVGAAAMIDFGHVPPPGGAGVQGVGDADEFGNAFAVAADVGEQAAHDGVEQTLHGG